MSQSGLESALALMQQNGAGDIAQRLFTYMYDVWDSQRSGWIRESDVESLHEPPCLSDVITDMDADTAHEALSQTAFVKLNGGLGTSMGLSRAKSMLPVRLHKGRNLRFIDIILGQIIATRTRQNVPLPLILMNSYKTSADSLRILKANRRFTQTDIPVEFIQHRIPKILVSDGEPALSDDADVSLDPDIFWCPPGHGDVYSSLYESGILDILQEKGIKYLFISNSDNLGARPSSNIAGYFARSGASFMVEIARKTAADIKGGHIVIDKASGRYTLRELSQVHPDDRSMAQDISRHPYFNTNNIWVRVDALKAKLEEFGGVLPLPVIYNTKTLDPTDPDTPDIIQLETAMGAAISLFDDSTCLMVDRPRFLPVKTTNDLFTIRSDRFHMTDSYEMEDGDYIFPNIDLDSRYFKFISDFDERFPYSVPSIAAANSVTVRGDWTFGRDVSFFGDALLEDMGRPSYVPNGEFVGPNGIEPDDWQ
jgi:UTP--glucose-1-phosphate uridylyltransferase